MSKSINQTLFSRSLSAVINSWCVLIVSIPYHTTRARQVLCSKCSSVCNEKGENVRDKAKKVNFKPVDENFPSVGRTFSVRDSKKIFGFGSNSKILLTRILLYSGRP